MGRIALNRSARRTKQEGISANLERLKVRYPQSTDLVKGPDQAGHPSRVHNPKVTILAGETNDRFRSNWWPIPEPYSIQWFAYDPSSELLLCLLGNKNSSRFRHAFPSRCKG